MSDNSFIGSQAFNRIASAHETVIPNSGSLTLAIPVVSLVGVNKGIALDVSLAYFMGKVGRLGLPDNWTFGLPFLTPNDSLEVNGVRYIIDTSWKDSTGYASGLKYENNHGRSFVSSLVPVALPYGSYPATYQYVYSDPDGSKCYFDSVGNLVMNTDCYGNYIYYAYLNNGALLDSIVDSFGQKTTFGYNPGLMVITTPDGRQTSLNYSSAGISSIVDPLENSITFGYTQQGSFNVIDTITYPSGKTTYVSYTALSFYNASQQTVSLPAVSDLKYVDASNNLLSHCHYAYGTNSGGNTFTGYNAQFTLSGSADGLLDSNNTLYLYDVQVSKLDEQGNILSLEDVFYSFAHVPVTHNTYVYDAAGSQNGFSQVVSTYNLTPDKHNQQPNYLSPKDTAQSFFLTASASAIPKIKLAMEYDEFANTTSKITSSYDTASAQYITQVTEISSYFSQSGVSNLTLVDTSTKADNVAGQTARTQNTLTPDNNAIATSAITFKNKGDATWNDWKEQSMTFDDQGRVLSEALKWTKPNAPGIQSASAQYSYLYDATTFSVTTTITNSLGLISSHQTSTMYSKPLAEIQSSGAKTLYNYDVMGRVTSKTLPSGSATTYSYKIFATDGENSSLETTALGYQTKLVRDALGQEITRLDNGNAAPTDTLRTLSAKQYDLLGNAISETDIFGNVTSKLFNSLAKPTQSIDPLGNKTVISYDFTTNSSTSSLNGIIQQQLTLDNYGKTLLKDVLPNTTNIDKNSQYTLRTISTYSGFSELLSETVSQVNSSVVTEINQKGFAYDIESKNISESFSAPDGTAYTKTFVLDLNKKELSQSKIGSYPDKSSLDYQGDVASYNSQAQLTKLTNNLEQSESYSYDDDGRLAAKTLFDGSVISYEYTPDGQRSKRSWDESGTACATQYAYDASGRLISTSDTSGVVSTVYSLDSIVTGICYPDSKSLSYTLDKYSRKIIQKDISSLETKYQFNALNQLLSVATNGDTLSYSYSSDTTKNSRLGALKSISLAGIYTETYTYDALDRKIGTNKLDDAGKILLDEVSQFTPLNQVSSSVLSSEKSSVDKLNHQRSYSYDALQQLVSDITNSGATVINDESFIYDGNHNVLAKTVNAEVTTYTYNSIDQLTAYVVGSAAEKTQTYTKNGDLFVDGDNRQYTFDTLGKLTSIEGTSNVTYSYYANDLLAQRSAASKTATMYYDSLQQCVNSAQANATSGFLLVGSKRYAAYSDGADPYYYGTNQHQDTVLGLSSTSELQGSSDYQAYGEQSGDLGLDETNNFTWNQEYKDVDSNLVYLRARYFDPKTMRFISRDSKRIDNRYAYGNGDPINNIDPSGHDATSNIELGVGIGVGVAAVGVAVGAAVIWGSAATAAVGGGAVVAGIGAGVLAGTAALAVGAGAGGAGVVAAGAVAVGAVVASTVAEASVGGAIGATIGTGLGVYVGAAAAGTGGAAVGGVLGGALGGFLGNASGAALSWAGSAVASAAGTAGTALVGAADAAAATVAAASTAVTEAVVATAAATAASVTEAAVGIAAAVTVGLEVLEDVAVIALL